MTEINEKRQSLRMSELRKAIETNYRVWRTKKRWLKAVHEWASRDFLNHPPQFVKQKIFETYGVRDGVWVETGTFLGMTTNFLSEKYPFVHSIEPDTKLYNRAIELFKGRNVEIHNDVSGNVFPALFPKLDGNINF